MLQRPKRSAEFGARIARIYEEHGFRSDQAASDFMNGEVSRVHLRDIRLGKVPGPDALMSLIQWFPEAAEDLRSLAGYEAIIPAHTEPPDTLPTPPGAFLLAERTTALPLGPPVSAQDQSGFGDPELTETFDPGADWRDRGADYVLEVAGHCLEPHICRGDWVAIKRAKTAQNGQVVVAQILVDAYRGELGDALTLKIWRSGDYATTGFYRADGTRAHSSIEGRIVGKVVGHMRKKLPSFK